MGLFGGVFNDGHAVGQHAGQHDVHGGAHGHHVQVDLTAGQTSAGDLGADQAVAHIHIGAHGHKALDVLIDGPSAQITAAGQGHLGPAEAAQQGAHQVVAGADLAGQLIGNLTVADVGAVDVYGGAVDGAHVRPQLLKDLEDQGDVADLGNVLNTADPVHQQGGGDDGNGGIFCAADGDGSVKGRSALNLILIQTCLHPLEGNDSGVYMNIRRGAP